MDFPLPMSGMALWRDGCPITHGGNNCDGDGFPILIMLSALPLAQDDEGYSIHHLLVQSLKGEILVFPF